MIGSRVFRERERGIQIEREVSVRRLYTGEYNEANTHRETDKRRNTDQKREKQNGGYSSSVSMDQTKTV